MGSFVETFVYILEIIKYFLLSYYVIGLKLEYGKKRYAMIPIAILGGVLVFVSTSYAVVDVVLGCAIVLLCFHEKKRLSLFCIVIEFIAISFIDLLIWLLLVGLIPQGEGYEHNQVLLYLIGNILGLLPWIILGTYIKIKKVSIRNTLQNIRIRNYILIISILMALIFATACLQGMILGELVIEIKRLIVIITAFFALFVVVLGVLYIYVADSRNKLAQINNLDKECLEYQKKYYARVMEKDEELRAFKHDVNKHLQSLKILQSEGKIDEMEDYLENITTIVKQEYIYKTGNIIADYIVNGVAQEISNVTPVSVSIVGKFPEKIKIDNTEMCVVLANILNNAKEAILEYDGDKVLKIIIKNYKERIYLTVENSSNKRNAKENKTTKKR